MKQQGTFQYRKEDQINNYQDILDIALTGRTQATEGNERLESNRNNTRTGGFFIT